MQVNYNGNKKPPPFGEGSIMYIILGLIRT